jgi:hypothetical protein
MTLQFIRVIDACFQNEVSVRDELKLLKTSLGISVVKDARLQVSIPPLNKSLLKKVVVEAEIAPPLDKPFLEKTPTQAEIPPLPIPPCKTVHKESFIQASSISSHTRPTSERSTDSSHFPVEQPDSPSSLVEQSMNTTSDSNVASSWGPTARDFLTVLQEAVSVRVHRAPNVASYTDQGGAADTACDSDRANSRADTSGGAVSCCGMADDGEGVLYGKAKIGVLYSGGVDSVVLAALVDRLACD